MDCKEFERLIPVFIEHKMDFMQMKQFKEHMDKCANCKEELDIQFLVREGIQRLEEGDAFDLQNELEQHLIETNRKIKRNYQFIRLGEILEILLVIALIVLVIWMII